MRGWGKHPPPCHAGPAKVRAAPCAQVLFCHAPPPTKKGHVAVVGPLVLPPCCGPLRGGPCLAPGVSRRRERLPKYTIQRAITLRTGLGPWSFLRLSLFLSLALSRSLSLSLFLSIDLSLSFSPLPAPLQNRGGTRSTVKLEADAFYRSTLQWHGEAKRQHNLRVRWPTSRVMATYNSELAFVLIPGNSSEGTTEMTGRGIESGALLFQSVFYGDGSLILSLY